MTAQTLDALCLALAKRTGGTWTHTALTYGQMDYTRLSLAGGAGVPDMGDRYGIVILPSVNGRHSILPTFGAPSSEVKGYASYSTLDDVASRMTRYDEKAPGYVRTLATRTPNAVAGIIERDVLPVAVARLESVEALAARQRAHDDAVAATVAEVQALGLDLKPSGGGSDALTGYVAGTSLTVRPMSQSVRFETFTPPTGAALAMLRALAEWTAANPGVTA